MGDVLRAFFESEVPGSGREAAALADLARAHLAREGGDEDTSEDLVVRLRDPRVFGGFAVSVLASGVSPAAKVALAEHAFDLLPLPRTAGDVLLTEARAPPRLLALAAFLADAGALTVLHGMHLLYAVFLDRRLVTAVDRRTRSRVLGAVLGDPETPAAIRVLYAALHLASVPGPEAHVTLRRILRGPTSDDVKQALATLAASEDGGRSRLTALARDEGLLSAGDAPDAPTALATIPRLPERLAALGRRWRGR